MPWKYCAKASINVTSGRFRKSRTVRLSSFLMRFTSIAAKAALPNRPSFSFAVRRIE